MAHIARLFCVLAVLGLSASAFATPISIVVPDIDPTNDTIAGTTTILTVLRENTSDSIGGYGIMSITDSAGNDAADYFQVDLLEGDALMVDAWAPWDVSASMFVALYDASSQVIAGAGDPDEIRFNVASAGTYYIGIKSSKAATYMTTFAISHTPEPATMSLLVIGGIALLKRRRKR